MGGGMAGVGLGMDTLFKVNKQNSILNLIDL